MKRAMPWSEQVDLTSSNGLSFETSYSPPDTDMDLNDENSGQQSNNNNTTDQPDNAITLEDICCDVDQLFKRAELYQEYMQQLLIPTHRGSFIPFTSWVGLGNAIKKLYDQPLHYLTNISLKQWDQLRIGSEDEHRDLDTIFHPGKAEATIWLIEEVHRHTSSHHHIAKLWSSDPMHDAFIDSIFPGSPSE